MTKAELIGGLGGMAFASLGYVTIMLILSRWEQPSFALALALALGFGGGVGTVRHRNR